MKFKSLKRRHEIFEIERKFQGSQQTLERSVITHDEWSRISNGQIIRKTLAAKTSEISEAEFQTVINMLSLKYFDSSRISIRKERRTLQLEHRKLQWTKNLIYLEISVDGCKYAHLLSTDANHELAKWSEGILRFHALPAAPVRIAPKFLILSPEAFGFLLHECIGHRLEADDHSKPLSLRSMRGLNFQVDDVPGDPNWPGYVPFDDEGIKGLPVRLLDGANGKQGLLTAKAGCLRAVSANWHPIVRQRCLQAKVISDNILPPQGGHIVIDEIDEGQFDGKKAQLRTRIQRWVDSKGNGFRLPPLVLELRPEELRHFKAFGYQKLYSPAAGCNKANQNGLEVSFYCPSAWMPLNQHFLNETPTCATVNDKARVLSRAYAF